MFSPWIGALRSVALTVPDLAQAETFYTQVWRLRVAQRAPGVLYLAGSGLDHHLLALHEAPGTPQIRHVSLRARSLDALHAVAHAGVAAGGVLEQAISPNDDPAGGLHLLLRDPHGRRFEVLFGDAQNTPEEPAPHGRQPDVPQRLAHAVLNTQNVPQAQAFLEQALGFVLADRTKIMAFMNCNSDHHSLALGDTDNCALNHIAFVMPTLDAVMRGGGRLLAAGHAIEWGPGRHGPGDNAFNYFIDPFGIVIEYTAEVEQVPANYAARGPADWAWPLGRVDHWGISKPPSDALKKAQRGVLFAASL